MEMVPVVRFFIICDKVEKDVTSDKLSCIGIVDTINAMIFPSKSPPVFHVIGIAGLTGSHQFRIDLISPKGDQSLMTVEGKMTSGTKLGNCSIVFGPQEIPVPARGIHYYRLLVDGTELGRYPILMEYAVPEPTPLSLDEIRGALSTPTSTKNVRVEVGCGRCQKKLVFQQNLDPASPIPEDARPFPTDGMISCECGNVLDATSIFRQAKAALGKPQVQAEAAATKDE